MADDSGNVIPVRIDVAGLEGDVAKVREIFAELFNSLKQYSSQAVAPVAVSGLTELNDSIKKTNISLSQLTDKLNKLVTTWERSATASRKVKQSTDDLDPSLKQHRKNLQDIETLNAKIETQDTEAVRTKAALTAQLKEGEKQLIRNAEAENALVQARKKGEAADKAAAKAKKDKTRADKESEDEMKNELKVINRQLAAYDRLKESIKQLQNEYVKLIQAQMAGGKTQKQAEKSPEAKAKLKEIEELTVSSKRFGEQFGDAGAEGIAKWGKGLTGIFSQIRTLAYILPGIGIAGIFNLIFEAIEYCVSELLDFNRTVKATVDYNYELAKSSQVVVDALIGIANALDSTKTPMLDYLKNQKAAAEARGENFAQLIPETKAVLLE
jgi:chromosome segregation ATPase